jgi:hypothetical protein
MPVRRWRGAALQETRRVTPSGKAIDAPALAALAALERIAQRAVAGEELITEKLGDRTADERVDGLGADDVREDGEGVDDAEAAVEADQHAAERFHDRTHGDERIGGSRSFAPGRFVRHQGDGRPGEQDVR